MVLAIALATLVPVDAARGAWGAFDAHLTRAKALLATTDLADPDVAEALEEASRLCVETERQARTRALARDQWVALGREDRAEALR